VRPSSQDGASDEELARRAVRDADAGAFEVLVARYEGRVYSLARRLTGSDADAEDALQDTFLRVHRRLATFRGGARFSTWLYRVATNSALMVRRRERRRRTEPLDAYLPAFDAGGRHAREAGHARAGRAEEILDGRRLRAALEDALRRLPDANRTAFVLRDLQELPTSEVAAVLRISEAAVRQRVHRARLVLRGYLSHLVGVEP
jgi:RNA polymerase sigma-70 factor (ECF subfamily)